MQSLRRWNDDSAICFSIFSYPTRMKSYPIEAFEHLVLCVRNDDEMAQQWLVDNDYRELSEFWDAFEGVEKSFKWLMENGYRPLAATVDAMAGDDKAKVFLITSGNRELAAFADACEGKAPAVNWLIQFGHKGWILLAREIAAREKKKDKSFFWSLLNFGNPFR